MISQTKQTPEKMLLTMRILCLALLWPIVVYSYLVFGIKKAVYDLNLFMELMKDPKYTLFFLIGILVLIGRVPLTNLIFGKILDLNKPDSMGQVLQSYYTPFILRLALAESAAIFGFLCAFLGGEISIFIILATSAAIAIAKEFPTLKKVKERVKAIRPQIHIMD